MIINSILQNDLYKFTMQQAVFHQYPHAKVSYAFKCRNEGIALGHLASVLRLEIKNMANLQLSEDECLYLQELGFFQSDYIEYLKNFRYDPSEVHISVDSNNKLNISIPNASWLSSILWEVPILYLVNELYFKDKTKNENWKDIKEVGIARLNNKIALIKSVPQFKFADFGTRRRFSLKWHEEVVGRLVKEVPNNIVGTSNVYLARKFGIKPIGTMAHEYIMAHIGLTSRIEEAQKRALHVWLQEYGTKLGIALTDTFTSKAFFKDFDYTLSRQYDGVRHDSGCPYEFALNTIKHYKQHEIDPRTKTIVFSDGLDVPKAIDLWKNFVGTIGVSFGIGTNLTNDLGFTPLNIVMKVFQCNDQDVVKLSDNSGKTTGNPSVVKKIMDAYKTKYWIDLD